VPGGISGRRAGARLAAVAGAKGYLRYLGASQAGGLGPGCLLLRERRGTCGTELAKEQSRKPLWAEAL
jgi:hypothetical protein